MGKFLWTRRLHSLNGPEGPLVRHLAQFQRLLKKQGYPEDSSRRHLRLIADFSVWLKAKRIPSTRSLTRARSAICAAGLDIGSAGRVTARHCEDFWNCCSRTILSKRTRLVHRRQLNSW
jgi:hypothetical protein